MVMHEMEEKVSCKQRTGTLQQFHEPREKTDFRVESV